MIEKEKMLAGKIYDGQDEELLSLRFKAHKLSKMYNDTFEEETEKRKQIIDELFPNKKGDLWLQGPIQIDYGVFTSWGELCYANFNLTILDTCPVTIGNNVFFGPNVSILTPIHPLRYQDRNLFYDETKKYYTDYEYGAPITIKDNCWIAGNVTICGGVTIGEGCVIGAGSVVTRNIPDNCFAAGNPCKVIR
jgi:maltose O-acetyltransferase